MARWLRLNIGTIDSEESVRVIQDGVAIGTLESSYAERLVPGDRFVLDGRALEVRRLEGAILQARSTGGEPSLPRWTSDRPSLSSELAGELAAFRSEAAGRLGEDGAAAVRRWLAGSFELDPDAAGVIVELIEAQERWSEVPSAAGLLVEEAPAPDGPGLVYTFHAPLHRSACDALARAVGARLGRRFGRNLTLAVADLGWSVRLPDGATLADAEIAPLLDLNGLDDDVLEGLDRGELLARRFRPIAVTALMVLRHPEPGRRVRVGGLNWVSAALPAGAGRVPGPPPAPPDAPRGAGRAARRPGRRPLAGLAPGDPHPPPARAIAVRRRLDRARIDRGPALRIARRRPPPAACPADGRGGRCWGVLRLGRVGYSRWRRPLLAGNRRIVLDWVGTRVRGMIRRTGVDPMSTVAPIQLATVQPDLPVASNPPQSAPELYRFTVDQYKRMGDAGILTDDDRVELVEGLLYRKPMKKGPHSIACRATNGALTRLVPAESYFVTREDPVDIPGRSGMPEPDISVVRGQSRDYVEQPGPGDVPLIVEVADKSRLAFDRGEKLQSYAGARIPVYWIINLVDRQVEVYSNPGPDGYQSHVDYKPRERVPVVIDGQQVGEIAVDDLLP